MADRFYARFNLSRADYLVFKEEFDKLQKERSDALKKEFSREAAALENKKVLFIGDSISSDNLGYRASVSLAASLRAVNGSLSSSTSATLLESSLQLIEDSKPEIVSIMLGTNDSLSITELGNNMVSLEDYEANMRKIIAKAKDVGAKILLFKIPFIEEKLFSDYFTERGKFQNNETISLYNAALSRIAEEEKIALVPHTWFELENLTPFFEPDGIHLSVMAQERFAKNWLINASKL